MFKPIFLAFMLMPLTLLAQDFATRAEETYQKTDKNFDIDCLYTFNKTFKLITPTAVTGKSSDSISRNFIIETDDLKVPMNFKLYRAGKNFEYKIVFDNKHESVGKLKYREFVISPVADKNFNQKMEIPAITCNVNFTYAEPFTLNNGDYHINVHPHTIYDWQGKIKTQIEDYLNNSEYESLILLESANNRGNLVDIQKFLDGVDYKVSNNHYESDLVHVPLTVPMVVSPAGNSRYTLRADKEVNITFTGGNHNYCIWNSARHVIQAFMKSKSEAKINFKYDTHAIIAQSKGVEDIGINFSAKSVKQSNLLADLLSTKEVQANYHNNYLGYFKGYLAQKYFGQYKTLTIHYKAEGYATTAVIQGGGTRNLEINFIYF